MLWPFCHGSAWVSKTPRTLVPVQWEADPKGTGMHHPAKAKRVIQLFMNGGASQMDLLITSRCSKNGMERSLIQGRAIASKRRPASQVRYSGPLFRSLDTAIGALDKQSLAPLGSTRRRLRLDVVDDQSNECPWSGKLPHEHRLLATRFSLYGCLD